MRLINLFSNSRLTSIRNPNQLRTTLQKLNFSSFKTNHNSLTKINNDFKLNKFLINSSLRKIMYKPYTERRHADTYNPRKTNKLLI